MTTEELFQRLDGMTHGTASEIIWRKEDQERFREHLFSESVLIDTLKYFFYYSKCEFEVCSKCGRLTRTYYRTPSSIYCSNDCLHRDFEVGEFDNLAQEDPDEFYYTETY